MKYLEKFGGSSYTRVTLISSKCRVGKTWVSPKKEKMQWLLLMSVTTKNVSSYKYKHSTGILRIQKDCDNDYICTKFKFKT